MPYSSPTWATISRVLMPRAYIETILSSKPGKRRWYLAISCGSKVACRSRGISNSIRPVSVVTVLPGTDPKAALDTNGLFDDLKKVLAERALNAEMDHHLAGDDGG